MKKIILLSLILLLSGCFEESGKLVTTCTKKENSNSLYSEVVYKINFKENNVDDVEITYYYNDSTSTLSSVKNSINSMDRYMKELDRKILIDNDNEFKISYNVNLNSDKEILNRFLIEEKLNTLVNKLEEQKFECK